MGKGITSRILRIIVSLGAVAGIIAVCTRFPHVHVASAVLLLLLAILAIATRWSFTEAAIATGTGALLLDYFFLPPKGLGIATAEHWTVLFTFVGVALVGSHFAVRARERANQAIARERELERLYAFGQILRIEGSSGSIVAACLVSLVNIFEVRAAAFCDLCTGEVTRAGAEAPHISEDMMHSAAIRSDLFTEASSGTLFVPIRCAGEVAGTMAISAGDMTELTLRAIADRIEVKLEKIFAYEKLRKAEATLRNQELKTALLDSLAHEIKTPLSVITTSVSSLLSTNLDPVSRSELVAIISEEADRLNTAISEIFWRVRVEATKARIENAGPHAGSICRARSTSFSAFSRFPLLNSLCAASKRDQALAGTCN